MHFLSRMTRNHFLLAPFISSDMTFIIKIINATENMLKELETQSFHRQPYNERGASLYASFNNGYKILWV